MLLFKVGDRVSVLKDTIRGKVVEIESGQVLIEDEHGFERKYRANQLVLLNCEKSYKINSNTILEKDVSKKLKKTVKSSEKTTSSKSFIDLHIECLVDNHTNLSNHEIVQKQMFACRSFVQKAIQSNKRKIVLIHGKGEGVLKAEIHYYLNRLVNQQSIKMDFHDAPYSEFGMGGATEVILY